MRISYDQATDSLYVHLADWASTDSDEFANGVTLDVDINGVVVGIDIQHASQRVGRNGEAVWCVYLENEDILQIRLSSKAVVREVSPDWQTNIGYAADGSIVELLLLDAQKAGLLQPVFPKRPFLSHPNPEILKNSLRINDLLSHGK